MNPELLDRLEFRHRYGGIPVDRPAPQIDPEDVPNHLSDLIPLAEKWGIIEDDWVPQDVIRDVPKVELEDLVTTLAQYITDDENDAFDPWLAGPESNGPTYSAAYLAFTELRIVFYDAEWDHSHWDEIH